MATLSGLFSLGCSRLCTDFYHIIVFDVTSDKSFLSFPLAIMERGKALNEAEKAINKRNLLKEQISPDDIATKIGCHVDTVKRFRKDQEQRKKDQMLGLQRLSLSGI